MLVLFLCPMKYLETDHLVLETSEASFFLYAYITKVAVEVNVLFIYASDLFFVCVCLSFFDSSL